MGNENYLSAITKLSIKYFNVTPPIGNYNLYDKIIFERTNDNLNDLKMIHLGNKIPFKGDSIDDPTYEMQYHLIGTFEGERGEQ